MTPLVVVAAGGTGGHMFPAQAFAEEMLSRGWRVALASDARGLRYAGGFPAQVARHELKAASFGRGGLIAKAKAPFEILAGVAQARRWMRAERPALVAGFGGYPSFPSLMAAWSLGVPRLIHEQNAILGRVNRFFAARVGAVALGVPLDGAAPAGAQIRLVGNPLRRAAQALAGAPYEAPREGAPIRLLAFGGSQGASVLATIIPQALAALSPEMRARLQVVHQIREADAGAAAALYAAAGLAPETAPFFADMPARIAAAHLIVSRAGASSVAEIAAIGRPSVLVPLPEAVADHQSANARALEKAEAAILAPQAALTPESLAATLRALFEHPARLAEMAEAARGLGRPEAAKALADLAVSLAPR